jgi:hypothetical protein
MNRNPTSNIPPQGRTIAVVGDVYRFLATGEDTNGKYALFEALVDRYVNERHGIQSAKRQTRRPV